MIRSVGHAVLENSGNLLENLIYLDLKRKFSEIYYYKTDSGFEIDFYLRGSDTYIQVAQHLGDKHIFEREVRSLQEIAMSSPQAKLYIVTEAEKKTIEIDNNKIHIVPAYEWLISNPLSS